MVMGYTSTGTLNAALLLGEGTAGYPTENIELVKNGGTVNSVTFTLDQSINGGNTGGALGEMSPQGKIALYVPNGTGSSHNADDTIQYVDATATNPTPTVIASVETNASAPAYTHFALSGGQQLPITSLQNEIDSVPEINDAGTIIFGADVYDASLSSDEAALLEWTPADIGSSPIVLLEAGQPADIDGTPSASAVESFTLSDLVQENDFYKNSVSDDNYIGVQVFYDDGSNAVIITQVPEPASMALISIAALGLLARRRQV
jgi:hypothetical protein